MIDSKYITDEEIIGEQIILSIVTNSRDLSIKVNGKTVDSYQEIDGDKYIWIYMLLNKIKRTYKVPLEEAGSIKIPGVELPNFEKNKSPEFDKDIQEKERRLEFLETQVDEAIKSLKIKKSLIRTLEKEETTIKKCITTDTLRLISKYMPDSPINESVILNTIYKTLGG